MNKVLPLLISFVLVVAIAWRLGHRAANPVAEQSFSTWSRHIASNPPAAVVAVKRAPQNETKPVVQLKANFSREKIEPEHAFFPQNHAHQMARAQDAERIDQALKSLPQAELAKFQDNRFHVVGARALSADQYSASMGEPIVEQNGFKIVGLDAMGVDSAHDESWKDLKMTNEGRPVLVNASNGRVAIVTGTLEVKLKSLESVATVADREHLQVLSVDEATNTAYYRAPAGYALFSGMKRLTTQAEVDRVELELYQSRKRAN